MNDRMIWRKDIAKILGVSTETISRWMKDGKLPKPDTYISRKAYSWRLSTLQEHGINLV
jgi:predicted DNA-binding transcriptional regulator AlpA